MEVKHTNDDIVRARLNQDQLYMIKEALTQKLFDLKMQKRIDTPYAKDIRKLRRRMKRDYARIQVKKQKHSKLNVDFDRAFVA